MTSISAVMNTALSGMLASEKRATATASNVANALTPGYDRLQTTLKSTGNGVEASVAPSGTGTLAGESNVDMAGEMLNMIETTQSYKANASVWEAGADMWDALASIKRD